MIFYGYSDASKRTRPMKRLTDALIYYRERFDAEPVLALVHVSVVDQLPNAPIPVEGRCHIPAHTIFLGHKGVRQA